MIIIAGSISINPERVDTILEGIVPLMQATSSEEGCIDYVLSADPVEIGKIRIFEKWASEEALAAHGTAPHMGEFQQVLKTVGVIGMSVQRFDNAEESKLF